MFTNITEDRLFAARVLIVDDHPANVILLRSILQRAGYRSIKTSSDPHEVLPLYRSYSPDIILLDLHMPQLDGITVMQQLKAELPPGVFLPILILTADVTPGAKQRALSSGAKDFLTKPFNATEVLLRIRNLLETRLLHLELRTQNERLEHSVQVRTAELEQAQVEIVERLALAAEYRDDDTGKHTQRVGVLAARIARLLGLPDAEVELLRRAAPLHDIGKIGVPDNILRKPGPLDPEEFARMRTHTTIGARIALQSSSPLLQLTEQIALAHHERWDGGGYPLGLAEDAIPLPGRIVAVADVFDALTHARPYKEAWPAAAATQEIAQQSGCQFDPQVVRAFLALDARDHAAAVEEEHARATMDRGLAAAG